MNASEKPGETKAAFLWLFYFDQTLDMRNRLDESGDDIREALEQYAERLDMGAQTLRMLRTEISGHDVSIETDTASIVVRGPTALIDKLITKRILDEEDIAGGTVDEPEAG